MTSTIKKLKTILLIRKEEHRGREKKVKRGRQWTVPRSRVEEPHVAFATCFSFTWTLTTLPSPHFYIHTYLISFLFLLFNHFKLSLSRIIQILLPFSSSRERICIYFTLHSDPTSGRIRAYTGASLTDRCTVIYFCIKYYYSSIYLFLIDYMFLLKLSKCVFLLLVDLIV